MYKRIIEKQPVIVKPVVEVHLGTNILISYEWKGEKSLSLTS